MYIHFSVNVPSEEKPETSGIPTSSTMTNINETFSSNNQLDSSVTHDSKLVVIQFSIDKMSLEVYLKNYLIFVFCL